MSFFSFDSFTNTKMQTLFKNHTAIISILAIGFLLMILFFFKAFTTDSPIAAAAKITDPDAKLLVEQTDRASRSWQTLDAEAKPLKDQLAKLEAEQTKLAGGNAGRMYTLCSQYGIMYVRGADGKPGTTKEATAADCAPLE